jgi:FkbM family methyltransferase
VPGHEPGDRCYRTVYDIRNSNRLKKQNIPFVEDLIYDVGLHKGEDTAFYLALGYRVVGFEAHPGLAALCRDRFAEQLSDGRLTIIEGAIAESGDATVTFFTHPNSVWGTVQSSWVARNDIIAPSVPITVPRIEFANALREHGVPHYLKIDIEGVDEFCLRTLLSLERVPTYVSIESQQKSWTTLLREFDLLESIGYDRFAVVQQGTIPGRAITTQTRSGAHLEYRFEADASGAFGADVGPWIDRQAAIQRYRRIFLGYRLLGAESLLRKTRIARGLMGQASRISGRPLPGWHDTHARLSGL